MSYLTDTPELMLEVLAVLVRRAGGAVTIEPSESLGPFNLLSRFDGQGRLHLALDETLTHEDVDRTNAEGGPRLSS